ncbi:MAG TPA: ADOP family duplicated permease [Gemmatimonadaceae bacterium]|nr:ADOP family duplicated permease [Gemmatimonadaceae bacterium]
MTRDTVAPPRMALWLLQHLLPDAERESFIGDLIEAHAADIVRLGNTRARRWFWQQALMALLTLHGRRTLAAPTLPAGDSRMLTFFADLRHGVRLLRRSPAFTILAVLTLALGVGATTAIFSVADPVLFRALPFPNADRLVIVGERDADGRMSNVGYATYADLARESRTLERAAAVGSWQVTLDGSGVPERVNGQRVSASFFSTLGVRPALGRDFVTDEDTPAANQVVILSHGLWARRYGRDSSIVDKNISINGRPFRVAGILPESYESVIAPGAEIWRVLGYDTSLPYACRTCRHLRMFARLRPDATPARAAAELSELSARLVREYPKEYPAAGAIVRPLADATMGPTRPVLWAVLGASVLVLLIAAANVANLQLARAMRREEEFAIRSALGAGRRRLTAQLLAEGTVLALIGGAAGLLVARFTLGALIGQLPATMPRLSAIRLDGMALAVGAAITVLLGVAVGLVPAARKEDGILSGALRGGKRLTRGRHLARAGLVVTEVAVALMLLVGAGLLGRSLVRLLSVDPGFDASNLLTLQAQAAGPKYPDSLSVYANHARIIDALRRLPGVERVGTASQLPLGGNLDSYGINAQDKPLANPELAPYADRYTVSPDFIGAMGIAIERGRAFGEADNSDGAPPVVIASAGLAKRIWPGEDPIGKRIRMGDPNGPWRTVIGIVGNIHHRALDADDASQIYIPERQWQFADNAVAVVVRTHGDPANLARAVRNAAQAVDMTQPITALSTMEQVIAASTAQRRLALLLFASFAALALVLAIAGIYGVLAGAVTERTREIGVRTALGATPASILAMVLLQGARLAGAGLLLGLIGALSLGRFLQSLLYGVGSTDPVTLAGVALLLAAVALTACLLPAMRALGIDPIAALRAE